METPPDPAAPRYAAFSGFARRWLDLHVTNNRKPSTVRSYEQVLRVHLVPFFTDADLRSIGPIEVEEFKATVRHTHQPKTVNNQLGVLSSLFSAAITGRYADQNPVAMVPRMRVVERKPRFWKREESSAFLKQIREKEPRYYALFLCALRTGMRQGELFALEWGHLNFRERIIHVQSSYWKGHTGPPKSGKNRDIPMSQELADALQEHRHLRGDLVFCRDDGSHLSGDR